MQSTLQYPGYVAPQQHSSDRCQLQLGWVDQFSRLLPYLLVGLPLSVTLLIISAVTPADVAKALLAGPQPSLSTSPAQVTEIPPV
ncbi:MAG: hypothetical protein HC921_09325 [Synechococcaceae cyanobacterium SM2_3_1]|nr:hypothetical protein [Synechococcaceae cyanobacterium SM2_3_1]